MRPAKGLEKDFTPKASRIWPMSSGVTILTVGLSTFKVVFLVEDFEEVFFAVVFLATVFFVVFFTVFFVVVIMGFVRFFISI